MRIENHSAAPYLMHTTKHSNKPGYRHGDSAWQSAKELWELASCRDFFETMQMAIKPGPGAYRSDALEYFICCGGEPLIAPIAAVAACEETLRTGLIKAGHKLGWMVGLAHSR